ncbi:MAG: FHA domain-containing protein [Planctomycetes bacterium]|nr:FHA domain-containing protein [Planctomycetota bacterium]MCB9829703.1 FHA domain-containing protein [Planctomycetota bacterium]MCB9900046.1 FHA domain-containing protein [Planctomycetota bacterium]
MTTIRIDIRGRQFEAELPLGQVVRLGRQAGLELTLEGQGVAAVHCSLEALPDGRVRLRDLESGEPTRRNGAVVRQAALSEGDVVEVGEVRVTVGAPGVVEVTAAPPPPASSQPAATRPAQRTGERTSERSAERSAERPAERTSSRSARTERSKVPWIVAGVAGVGLLALWMVFGRSPPPAPRDPRIVEAQADAEAGRYEHAASLLQAVEADGRSDDVARQLADRVARGHTRIENAIAELTIVRLDKTDAMLAEHRRELLERFGEDAGPRFDQFLVDVRDARQAWLDERAEVIAHDADAWKREHRFDLWRAAWDTVGRSAPAGIDAAARVAEGQAEVVSTANAYAERLAQQVEEKLENGLVWRAVDDVERVIAGYKGFAVHATLEKLLERARIEKARPPVPGTPQPTTPVAPTPPPESTPPDGPTTDEPAKPLPLDASGALAIARAAASEALEKRDFTAAAAAASAASASVPDGAPRDAVRAYAADLTRAQAGVSHLVDAIQADAKHFRNVAVGGRLRVDVRKADAAGFDAVVQGGESRFTWTRLATSTWDTLLQRQDPEGEAAFDAACLARALGLESRSDALLVKSGASGFDEASLFRVIARWRGIDLPADGFVPYDGRYVTLAEREALEREKAIVAALADVASTKPEVRQAAYARLLAFGEHAAPRFAEALRVRRAAIVDSLASAPGWTSAKTKSRLFEELEKRRAFALDLIRDEQAYPYPNPDHRSQPEVEERVAAVRQVWENPFELIVGWDEKLKEDLGQLAEVDDVFVKVDPAHDASLDAIAKRVNEAVDMPAVVPDAGAAKLRQYSLEVLAFNLKTPVTCTFEERDNVLAVNEYRMMMGLNAVKIHERLVRAARGHSRHMKENGYFAHDVPADKGANAENRSPGARAKAQGYGGGVGENIAMGLHSGRDAFKAWFTSSGHHRNMLGKGWTEMGCGRSGAYWTQLFGAMTGKSLDVPEPLPDPPPFYAPQPEAAPRSARRNDDDDEGVE